MYLANRSPRAGRYVTPPLPGQSTAPQAELRPRADPREMLLGHALLIAAAESDDDLLTLALAAVLDATGASAALAVGADGSVRHRSGCADLAARIETACAGEALSAFLADAGPAMLTASLGDLTIMVAAAWDDRLDPAAATLLSLVVAHARACRARLIQLAALTERAQQDPLTGLPHAGTFAEQLRAVSPNRTAVILADLDDFKKVNDAHGHQAGDAALLCVVEALRAGLRAGDRLFRVGGDEFAIVLDVNRPKEVVAVARRLLNAAREAGHRISIGAAIHVSGETGRDTLDRADQALYRAKRSGRDTLRMAR